MWIKLLLGLCVIAFCVLLGYLAAGKYRARKVFFAEYLLFHERYLTELTYLRKPLSELLQEHSYQGDFGKQVEEFARTRQAPTAPKYLTLEEAKLHGNYFSMLGKGDSAAEKNFFSAQTPTLREKKEASEQEAKKRGELYLKLGLLAGLALVILII